MQQQLVLQKDSDTQAGDQFQYPRAYDQWLVLWHSGIDATSPSPVLQPGVAAPIFISYSPVRLLIQEKAKPLAALQERRIRKLQQALIDERLDKYKDKEDALSHALFSLYKEELISMSEVIERIRMNKWEFFEYLDSHPEYRQVDIDSLLGNVKED